MRTGRRARASPGPLTRVEQAQKGDVSESTKRTEEKLRAEVGRWPRKSSTTSSTAKQKNDWLSDANIAAFMATVDAPEAILV